jgi:2-C-methyl-D-erythritol 2,4-cyclodiphosphate synthase
MGAHVSSCGFAVEHVDAYVTLGRTRLSPHLDGMRANLADAMSVPVDRVSVKAGTNDGLPRRRRPSRERNYCRAALRARPNVGPQGKVCLGVARRGQWRRC